MLFILWPFFVNVIITYTKLTIFATCTKTDSNAQETINSIFVATQNHNLETLKNWTQHKLKLYHSSHCSCCCFKKTLLLKAMLLLQQRHCCSRLLWLLLFLPLVLPTAGSSSKSSTREAAVALSSSIASCNYISLCAAVKTVEELNLCWVHFFLYLKIANQILCSQVDFFVYNRVKS